VLTTIRSPSWAILYLLIFGLGTIVGMMMTTVIVLPFAHGEHRFARISGGLRVATSVLSVAFGLFIAYRIGIVHGLFTGDPNWTPS
jgi:high-affinity nickel-transport protein